MAKKTQGAKSARVVKVTAKRFKGANIETERADEALSPHDIAKKYKFKGAKGYPSFSDAPG